jgi:hypothetical protein
MRDEEWNALQHMGQWGALPTSRDRKLDQALVIAVQRAAEDLGDAERMRALRAVETEIKLRGVRQFRQIICIKFNSLG